MYYIFENGNLDNYYEIFENKYMYNNNIYNFSINENNDNNDELIVEKSELYGINAFQNDNLGGLNILIKSEEFDNSINYDLNKIKIYECQGSTCNKTKGFMRYNYSYIITCDYDECDNYDGNRNCENENDAENIYYDDGSFKICTFHTNDEFILKELYENSKYAVTLSNKSQSQYKLYILSDDENIIGISTLSDSYFMDINDDGNNEIVFCIGNENGSICKINEYGYYLENGETKNLIYCDNNSVCEKIDKNGYFFNSFSTNVIRCHNSKCDYFSKGNSCSSKNNEVILYDNTLYYCYNEEEISFSDISRFYELRNINANSLYPEITDGNDIILLKIDKFSVTQYINEKTCISSYHEEDATCSSLDNDKYFCPELNKSCTKIKNGCDPENPTSICDGYYFVDIDIETNIGKFYECSKDSNDEDKNCILKDGVKGYFKVYNDDKNNPIYIMCDGTSCKLSNAIENTCKKVGDYVMDGSVVKLCISSYEMVGFSSDDELMYSYMENKENNILGTEENGDYIIISISKNSMVPYVLSDIETNIYMINNKIYSFVNDHVGEVSINKPDIYGYLAFYTKDDIILIKNEEIENGINYEYSYIRLYYCDQNNKCEEVSGYLRYNYNTVIKCSNNDCTIVDNNIDCSNENNVGKVFYDENLNFQICVINGDSTEDIYISKNIQNDHTIQYISSLKKNEYSIYNVYITNENGYIVCPYTFGDDLYIDINNNGIPEILLCDENTNGSECEESGASGYFLNKFSKQSNELIYCDEDYNCEASIQNNGYFINDNNKVIRCHNSVCELFNPGSSCSSKNNEVILYNNYLYYCYDNSMIDFDSTIYYYELKNIDADSIYPKIVNGNDNILLKIDEYSVTQYINSKIICISSSNEESSCYDSSDIVYQCSKINVSCTHEINICDPKTSTNSFDIDEKTNEGTLYKCIDDNKVECTIQNNKTAGYYRETDINLSDPKYIYCDGNKCKTIETPKSSECENVGGGNFISSWELCISSSKSVTFTSDKDISRDYILTNNESNVFETATNSEFIIISVSYDTIFQIDISNFKNVNNIYLIDGEFYSIKNNNNMVEIKKETISEKYISFYYDGNAIYNILTYVHVPFEKFSDMSQNIISNLYTCENIENSCKMLMFYYVKYGPSNNINIAFCEYSCNQIENKNECNSTNNINSIYYDTSFKICIYKNNEYSLQEIPYENYIFTNINGNLYGYKYEKGYPIVKSPMEGYFYSGTELNDDDKYDLLYCTSGSCKISKNYGYFINSESETFNDLIYCNNSGCEKTKKDDGYFVNSVNDVIICYNKQCSLNKNYNYSSCNTDDNIYLIKKNSEFYFCNGNTKVTFYDYEQYYSLSNVNANSFPYYENGKDTILLKLDDYSISQYYDSKEICIYNNKKDANCSSNNSIKYTCLKKSSSCTISYNICDPKKSSLSCHGYYLVDIDSETYEGTLYNCVNKNNLVTCNIDKKYGVSLIEDNSYRENNISYNDYNYIVCLKNKKCKLFTTYDLGHFCSKDTYVIGNGYSITAICINSSTPLYFSDSYTNEYEFVEINNSEIFDTTQNFALLEKTKYSIFQIDIESVPSNNYMINNEIYSIDTKDKEKIKINKIKNIGIFAFIDKSDLNFGIESLVTSKEFSSDMSSFISYTKLYYCNTEGCSRTSGYIKYKSKNDEKVIECRSDSYCNVDTAFTNCENSLAYYDSGFKICVDDSVIDINEINSNYVFIKTEYENELYEPLAIDNNKAIIGNLVLTNGDFYVDIDGDNKKELMSCFLFNNDDNFKTVCVKLEGNGYFTNYESNKPNELIFCNNNNECKTSKQNNGFFINSKNDIIKCVNNECTIIEDDGYSSYYCNGNDRYKIKKIGLYNNLVLCYGSNDIIEFRNETKYIKAYDIDANSVYPEVSYGKDIIMLKMDKYSVIQYTTGYLNCIEFESDTSSIVMENEEIESGNKVCYACKDIKKSCYITNKFPLITIIIVASCVIVFVIIILLLYKFREKIPKPKGPLKIKYGNAFKDCNLFKLLFG
ncbi:hypothetical protein BCR32DRAFT_270003 [Anaeromyces robustus]|uniref:Scaffoldin n=1 Tax=Anaeromyces robustus TaxID=1754192 RepID=A0A1Y1WYK5_9FUNG|nr:hypothetical protein BCR32DRAFT_270003 [Anaeromyces robustus]|eukprot:ORX78583.1 hypothetical protein BCR32DRAFT_270003 [Anaeromyces robustus]